jgi:hypothetical protein
MFESCWAHSVILRISVIGPGVSAGCFARIPTRSGAKKRVRTGLVGTELAPG